MDLLALGSIIFFALNHSLHLWQMFILFFPALVYLITFHFASYSKFIAWIPCPLFHLVWLNIYVLTGPMLRLLTLRTIAIWCPWIFLCFHLKWVDVSLLLALVIIMSLIPMLNTLSILCMIVLFTVFPLIPLLLEGWLGGRMVLGCLRRHLTFGIRCGLRLGALRLVSYFVLKRMLNGGTNMLIVVLSADSSICYRRNWLAPFPRKLKIISGLK